MADFNDPRPQIVDPDLVVEIARLLKLRGQIGELVVSDQVELNLLLGSVGFVKSLSFPPAFDFQDFASAGLQTAAAANTVHAATATLPVGSYDMFFTISHEVSLGRLFQIRFAPTTQQIDIFIERDATLVATNFAIEITGTPQVIDIINLDAFAAGERSTASIQALPRPSPGFSGSL